MNIGNTGGICQRCYHSPCCCGPRPGAAGGWPLMMPWPRPYQYFPVCPKCWGYGTRYDAETAKTLECECGALAIWKRFASPPAPDGDGGAGK